MFCSNCSNPLSGQAAFCPQCGHPTVVNVIPKTSTAELVTAYVVSALIPLFGFILGVWLWNWRKKSGPGGACIILGFLCPAVLFGLIAMVANE